MTEHAVPSTTELMNVGTCISCRKPILMDVGEKAWWDKKLAEVKHMTFPRRCKPCREQMRREKKTGLDGTLRKVYGRIQDIASQLEDTREVAHAVTALDELAGQIADGKL